MLHEAAQGEPNVENIQYLLEKDPESASRANDEAKLLFHLACESRSNPDAARTLFDACPEAVLLPGALDPGAVRASSGALADFFEAQVRYAREALTFDAMHTLDVDGRLPLHRALCNGAPLGAVRLLLKGNPSVVRVADYNHVFPMHVACEFCGTDVVQHLAGINTRCNPATSGPTGSPDDDGTPGPAGGPGPAGPDGTPPVDPTQRRTSHFTTARPATASQARPRVAGRPGSAGRPRVASRAARAESPARVQSPARATAACTLRTTRGGDRAGAREPIRALRGRRGGPPGAVDGEGGQERRIAPR